MLKLQGSASKSIVIDKEIDALAKSLMVALDKLREWLDEQRKEDHSGDIEFMMLFEMLESGVAYLSFVAEIMTIFHSLNDQEKLEFKVLFSDIIRHIKEYVRIIKIAAFNEA